jgi:hypothetical protein
MDNSTWELIKSVLPLIAPIIIIQMILAIYCLVDLSKRVRIHGPRWLWIAGLIISAVALPSGLLVSGLYLVWGRHVEEELA